MFWLLLCLFSCLWQFASASSQHGVHMPLCPCGQHLVTLQLYHPWLLLLQLSSPSPPPFTTLLSIWSSSPTSASPCVGIWPSAEGHYVDVCVSTVQHRREPACNPITKRSATLQGCQMGCQRTMGPADIVLALKQLLVPEKSSQTTAPSKLPGYLKDRYIVRWLSVSCPMSCKATSSRQTNTARRW